MEQVNDRQLKLLWALYFGPRDARRFCCVDISELDSLERMHLVEMTEEINYWCLIFPTRRPLYEITARGRDYLKEHGGKPDTSLCHRIVLKGPTAEEIR